MSKTNIVCFTSICLLGGFGYVLATNPPGYGTPVVTVPLYGAGLTQQPDNKESVEERLIRIESKLDKLLKIIEDELVPDPPPSDPKASTLPTAALISGATKCAGCHAADKSEEKGGSFALFTPAGTFATLNNRQLLQLRKRLVTTDPSFQMPPPKSGVLLTESEKAALVAAFVEPVKKESNP